METTTNPEAKMTANDYLNQPVIYGGETTTRGAMILDLERVAATWTDDPFRQQQMVNMYLAGFEHARCA